jgi:hypothetical protein
MSGPGVADHVLGFLLAAVAGSLAATAVLVIPDWHGTGLAFVIWTFATLVVLAAGLVIGLPVHLLVYRRGLALAPGPAIAVAAATGAAAGLLAWALLDHTHAGFWPMLGSATAAGVAAGAVWWAMVVRRLGKPA